MDKQLVLDWIEAKAELSLAKANEMKLRLTISDRVLVGHQKGVKHLIVEGLDVAATGKINTTLDPELVDSLWPDLNQDERDCIKRKPELVAAKYKTLPDDSLLHQAVTTKPGTPTLSVKPVKE